MVKAVTEVLGAGTAGEKADPDAAPGVVAAEASAGIVDVGGKDVENWTITWPLGRVVVYGVIMPPRLPTPRGV